MLTLYSHSEIKAELDGLTGIPTVDLLKYAQTENSVENVRWALHLPILEANNMRLILEANNLEANNMISSCHYQTNFIHSRVA